VLSTVERHRNCDDGVDVAVAVRTVDASTASAANISVDEEG
jgi:hypothetical protein